MLSLVSETDLNSRDASKPKGSAWQVYGRLVGYAWQYKARLAISLFFAFIIAASFMVVLVSVGSVVNLAFYDPAEAGPNAVDPKIAFLNDVEKYRQQCIGLFRRAPDFLSAEYADSIVEAMRSEPMRWLKIMCAIIVPLSLLIGLARFVQEYYAGSIGARITTDLGQSMYENLIRQSVGFFETHSSGEVIGRFTNDIFMVNNGLSGVFVKLMREPIKVVCFLFVALSIDPVLTLVGVGVLPPVAYILLRIGKKLRRSVRRSLQKIASMASVVNETVRGITIVKGYNMEEYEISRVREEIRRLRRFLFQMVRLNAATGPITEFLLIVGLLAFVLVSGQRVVNGELNPGHLISLYLALGLMLDPVRKLSSVNNQIQTSVASAERVFEFIDLKPDIEEADDAVPLEPMNESLRFEDVHFCYKGKEAVLRGIDLEIKKGEMVALVGFSGAGKSTLVKLIPRFYDVVAGAVKIDGVDIREATLESLRDQISIVTQDTILFAESIRDNIAFGKQAYSDERVREAAMAANAAEFIEELPEGYNTRLGEGGVNLSGGQRQRLAIARAFIKDPAILILDEATSSLDSRSEQLIQEALDHFLKGRTAMVIAHRLSTIQRADRIVVIDNGRVAEEGTHEELLRHGGMYKRLYDTQFGIQERGRA